MPRFAILLTALGILPACETVEGAGEDVQKAGQGISNTAQATENELED